jgi:CRISPR-associated endonuclease/helicase Cas3
MSYDEFFRQATKSPSEPLGREPYPYQRAFAEVDELPQLLNVPTGVGKTATAILGWLYHRRTRPEFTSRRLVYCLPMRTLVEQTRDCAVMWLDRLGQFSGKVEYADEAKTRVKSYTLDFDKPLNCIAVHVLMGGADSTHWDEHPERDAILIGTQDMLLSRALNRGYGMSRYRWPMHFGLLNNDCFWVMDETQLMGVGLTTTAQLQGLRAKLATYGVTHSLWMSATLDAEPITTVDHPRPEPDWRRSILKAEDYADKRVLDLWTAPKPCGSSNVKLTSENAKLNDTLKAKGKPKAKVTPSYVGALAEEVVAAHQEGTLTLIVVNRVDRAQRLMHAIKDRTAANVRAVETELIHSRFRPADRDVTQRRALDEDSIPAGGRVLVATQAIEAGVDLSATTLFTELAPWPSLVQRFGRCNRRGLCGKEDRPSARVVWVDIDTDDKKADELALPYSVDELKAARRLLNPDQSPLDDVGPESLSSISFKPEPAVVHTLRRKDLIELWDTTPDLAGNDLDISRFIRDADNNDVQVYWRDWDRAASFGRPPELSAPERQELCSVSIGRIKEFLDKLSKQKLNAWRWNPLDAEWEAVASKLVRPGIVLLLHADASGYQTQLGWTGDVSSGRVPPVELLLNTKQEANSDDALGRVEQLLSDHLRKVADAAKQLRAAFGSLLADIPWDAIEHAAWWHDVGKAHEAFQTAMHASELIHQRDPDKQQLWAKSGSDKRPDYRVGEQRRRGFRHELASALAWLHQHPDAAQADLIAYLIAAHHGKVRLSLRSLPNEARPADMTRLFARGVWDQDNLPMVTLGNGDVSEPFEINLELMKLGESKDGQPSWAARVLKLRDDPQFGPFKLAFLEALLRVADWRGSSSENNQ